jgi:hypothetical protein
MRANHLHNAADFVLDFETSSVEPLIKFETVLMGDIYPGCGDLSEIDNIVSGDES